MNESNPRETLASVGEFGVIARLVSGHDQPSGVLLGPGDDAAVIRAGDGRTVVSTDMLVEGRHFRRDWSTPQDIGRKAIAQNAADIEAMGAVSTAFVVAFGAPADTLAADVQALSEGMWAEATSIGSGIAGGDLVDAPQWVISVTALGDLEGREAVRLGGARAGDVVAVVGDLGLSAAGYFLWHNGVHSFENLRQRHLVPEPPYGAGPVAAAAGATAMTDVSDGLFADLGHVARASGVGVDVSDEALGADYDAVRAAADVLALNPQAWVLAGGEDHALVATFPDAPPEGWRVIGRVIEGPARVLLNGESWHGDAGWRSY